MNNANYVIRMTPGGRLLTCHVDRLIRYEGDVPPHWAKDIAKSNRVEGTEVVQITNSTEQRRQAPQSSSLVQTEATEFDLPLVQERDEPHSEIHRTTEAVRANNSDSGLSGLTGPNQSARVNHAWAREPSVDTFPQSSRSRWPSFV